MNRSVDCFLFLAEPFGFGPISSTIAVARHIKRLDPRKRCLFIGCGTSHQLAIHSNVFDEIYLTEEMSGASITAYAPTVTASNCIVVANTYPTGVAAAKSLQFPCIFIDTLFWMWSGLPIDPSDVVKYYIEDFHCADIDTSRFGSSHNFEVIPPLVDTVGAPRAIPHPFLLISLGGIDSNLYGFPIFYEQLIDSLSRLAVVRRYTILICGGGKRFRDRDFAAYEHSRLRITCLGSEEYLSYLRSTDIVVASAGLHTFYENYFLRKNVMFLPPQSFSQYLQLRFIQQTFPGVVGTNFEHLGIPHTLREHMPEAERINEMKRVAKEVASTTFFNEFLNVFEQFSAGHLHTDWSVEHRTLKDGGTNGPHVLAESIISYAEAIH